MTTGMERELRELFRDKAGEAPVSTIGSSGGAPQRVLRRGRRRQVGTVLGSTFVAIVLAVGSFAGLRSLLRSDRDPFQSGQYEVFERTATIEAFTVTSPSDWYLVNQWPLSMLIAVEGSGGSSSACVAVPGDEVEECNDTGGGTSSPIPVPHGLPMIQLSNVDLGLATNACADGLPADAAALYVAVDAYPPVGGNSPPIPEFPPGAGMPPEGDGPCGPGRYAQFKVNGEPLFAWIGTGSDVSAEDRETVETAYETMSAIPDWEHAPPNSTTPAYVIAGGSEGTNGDWRLELRPDAGAVELSLEDGPAPTGLLTDGSTALLTWTGTDPIFGVVTKEATGIEFRPGVENEELDLGGSPVAGTVLPTPPSMGSFDFDLFFIDPPAGYGELGGRVIALGIDDLSPSPTPAAQADVVSLSGGDEDHTWIVRFSGSFDDGTACIRVRLDADPDDPLCPGTQALRTSLAGPFPSMHGWLTSYYLLAGTVPFEVERFRFVGDDGRTDIQESQCTTGPIGWTGKQVCAISLPGEGSGTLEYLDAEGNVIFEDGMGWAAAAGPTDPTPPIPVDPVHGGTYWAVYPWVGAPGSREADDVSAALLQDFGIEASPGDLACDQGAAEALGTDAEQGIGVYFETEDEANAFAEQAGLLGHEGDPVIAEVTTFCLD